MEILVGQAEFWYNSSYHTSLGCSPFYALYGYNSNVGLEPSLDKVQEQSVPDAISSLQSHAVVLKEHLSRAQNKMKLTADRKRKDQGYQVGEMVLLKLQPYGQSSLVNRPYPKLAFKYFGPYKVLERVGNAAYKLLLPPESLIHPIFLVSQLKPFVPDYSPIFSTLPVAASLDREELKLETVLERGLVKKGGKAIPQVLIKWATLPAASAT